MSFFKKLFGSKDSKPKNDASQEMTYEQIPWMTEARLKVIDICLKAGFRPARSLPTDLGRELRPTVEIANRLHAIKAMVLWVLVPQENVSDEAILTFVDQNKLTEFMTVDEIQILNTARDDESLRNSIGWKFENAWPLAWYFGFEAPEITGEMMSGELMQEILLNYTCSLDETVANWIKDKEVISEEILTQKEDLFYCLHNAVRSAQLGKDTVPEGFHPVGNGGVIHERRHALTWMLSKGVKWEDTDLST
ncbi:MAG: DUF4272 domain-containing protein [Bacteroidota bacterium]